MSRPVAAFALFALLVLPAASFARADARMVDFYIRAEVAGRVPGENAAFVDVRWDFKCLGDRLGPATYAWTMKVIRRQPRPIRTIPVGPGTTKTGSRRLRLPPGSYEPLADPFRCETELGAGSTTPEAGIRFVVPDYCTWLVAAARGDVGLERARSVEALRRGGLVRPGDLVFADRGATLTLRSRAGGTTVRLGKSTRVRVDARHCGRRGGWRLTVLEGHVGTSLAEADRRSPYELATAQARTSASRARWTVTLRGRVTIVRVQAGRVSVRGRRGGQIVLRPGQAALVRGAGPPRRGRVP